MYPYTLSTGKAAVFLMVRARNIHPKLLEVDWHSFLKENRRNPLSNSAIAKRSVRGNSHIFGLIPSMSASKKVFYSQGALEEFLELLKLKPGLVEYLVKRVGE